jgi:hypothetical protein
MKWTFTKIEIGGNSLPVVIVPNTEEPEGELCLPNQAFTMGLFSRVLVLFPLPSPSRWRLIL